jgi:hypothetical protein
VELALSFVAIQNGDAGSASNHYSILRPHGNSMYSSEGVINADRILALLARTMGNLSDAQSHFEDALTFCRNAGYRPELAWSLHDYADMLLERDNAGDPEKATAMLEEALQISTDLGMRPLMERVLSKRDILKA